MTAVLSDIPALALIQLAQIMIAGKSQGYRLDKPAQCPVYVLERLARAAIVILASRIKVGKSTHATVKPLIVV